MKKIYQSKQHKRHQRSRQRSELKKKRNPSPIIITRRKRSPNQRQYTSDLILPAPENFSLLNNTEELIKYCNTIRDAAKQNRDIVLDLRRIQDIGTDALTIISATASNLYHNGYEQKIRVNPPHNKQIQTFLNRCGINKILAGAPYDESTSHGRFERRSGNKVEPRIANGVKQFTIDTLFPDAGGELFSQKAKVIYGTLIECMSNTHGHASKDQIGEAEWWLSVYCDQETQKAHFSFVDCGIGILQSANVTIYRKGLNLFKSSGIILDVLEGKVPSSTKQKGRGEGLPKMKSDCQDRGFLENLTIISNNVKACVDANSFIDLENEYAGTYVYWELSYNGVTNER